MQGQRWIKLLFVSVLLLSLAGGARAQGPVEDQGAELQAAMGTAWTYQGYLSEDGGPAVGSYDLQFMLYDAATGGTQVGSTVLRENVPVADGYFTVQLDFGGTPFSGQARYLAIAVRPGSSSGAYTALLPRQPLTPTPYALYAQRAGSHSHLGETWTGTDNPLAIEGTFTTAPLVLSNAAGGGLQVDSVGEDGVYVSSAGYDGVYVYHAVHNGVFVRSAGNYAGYLMGDVYVNGSVIKPGGLFQIDHPLDPENKVLNHSFVESPDMMNVYNGNVTTDEAGYATVGLPDYFEVLNRDYRYQLTVIGTFAQAIIAQEVEDGQFVIQTDQPQVKVSWQVTGIRQDPWAEANRIVVEEDKPPDEQGTYLHPEVYGLPEEKGLAYKEAQEHELEASAREQVPGPEVERPQKVK